MARTKGARGADYAVKRAILIERLMRRLSRIDAPYPSVRQLAEAAEVTVPTLHHYFGDRDAIVEAVMEEWRQRGQEPIQVSATPSRTLDASIRDYVDHLRSGLTAFDVGDILSVGYREGLQDQRHGATFLRTILEPTINGLTARLSAHQAAGQMKGDVDPRFAAIGLIAPVLLAFQHQQQFFGSVNYPMDFDAFCSAQIAAFLSAYRVDEREP